MRIGSGIVLAALAGSAASAQPYIAINAGAVLPSSMTFKLDGIDPHATYRTGYAVGGQVGYRFKRVRIEAEGTYNHAGVDTVSTDPLGKRDAQGYYRSFTVTANALYDVPLSQRVTVYGGGGLGYGRVSARSGDTGETYNGPRTNVRTVNNGKDLTDRGFTGNGGFVYQFIAGADYKLSRKVSLGVRYKYAVINNIDTSAYDFHGRSINYVYGKPADYKTNSLLASLRFDF